MFEQLETNSACSSLAEDSLVTYFLLRALASLFRAGTSKHGSASSNDSPVVTLEGHKGSIRRLCFTQDERILISGSNDSTIRYWDVHKGFLLRKKRL